MRQIDADALKDNMFGYAPPEMTWDRSDIEHKIDEMPTIDAIPVEWLRERKHWATIDGDYWAENIIRCLLEDWQKEQEVR